MTIRPSGSWNADRPDATAATRVTAYACAAGIRGRIEGARVTLKDGRTHDLHLADLEGLLGILAELCPDHECCANCGAVSCGTCAIGEPLTDCNPPHCADDAWCFDEACMQAWRDDQAAEARKDGT